MYECVCEEWRSDVGWVGLGDVQDLRLCNAETLSHKAVKEQQGTLDSRRCREGGKTLPLKRETNV